jgi:archaetidylinositol phosphate synthase
LQKLKEHKRVNDILLGPLERPALHWLAAHMPKWVTPDFLTGVGVAGVLVTLVGYILSGQNRAFLWLASLGFVINWFGDSLDGTLARYRHIERPRYGFYIDHVVDAVSEVLVFTGLGLSPYVSFNVAMVALVGYMLLSVLVYLLTYLVGIFQLSYGKLGPTEVRVLAILMNTSMFFFGIRWLEVPIPGLGKVNIIVYDLVVGAVGFLLFWFFLSSAWRHGKELRKLGE